MSQKERQMKLRFSYLTRREMMRQAGLLLGAASSPFAGLALSGKEKSRMHTITRPGSDRAFPYLEFSADTYFELGKMIGKTFATQIQIGLSRRRDLIKLMKAFAEADLEGRYQGFIEALKKHFPQYLDELKGEAEGAAVPFFDLMILNLNPEYSMLMRKPSSGSEGSDCSTVISRTPDRVILAHNEDGSGAYQDAMYVLKVKAPSGVTFLCMSYPGIIAGNAPGFNDQGIAHSCNFISSKEVKIGVPRYFLDRAMLEARDLDHAVGFAGHPARAYSQNHNLVSYPEKRALMVETTPSKYEVKEVDGLAFHTNHFVLDEMKDVPESRLAIATSTPRYNVLKKEAGQMAHPTSPEPEDLVKILSSHKGKPFSPCRHPSNTGLGCTLGTAVFDTDKDSMQLFKGNPCNGKHETYRI
jgi:isopenicillin-N N-acyltransferase-like protein